MSEIATLPPPTNETNEKHVFFSYSSNDRPFVSQLANDVFQHGFAVWVDNIKKDYEGIRVGEVWKQALANALNEAALVIFVISPDSVRSKWVQAELHLAGEIGKVIAPILLRPIDTDEESKKAIEKVGTIIHGSEKRQTIADTHRLDFHRFGYESERDKLLKDLHSYIDRIATGVLAHIRELERHPFTHVDWGIEQYIRGDARLLPIDASPYDIHRHGERGDLVKIMQSNQTTLVLGEPGRGKSVALERLSQELVRQDPPIVPIRVQLRLYKGQGDLMKWIQLDLEDNISLKDKEETEHFLKEVKYQCAFLLDGLNEVGSKFNTEVVSDIVELQKRFGRCHKLVITSRVQDEKWRLLRHTVNLDNTVVVQLIRTEQAQAYLAVHLGEETGQELWKRLNPTMRELVTTPLLLYMLKEIWRRPAERKGRRLPENRGELYREFIVRMRRRDLDRGIVKDVPIKSLERLGLKMHAKQTRQLHPDEVQPILEKASLSELLKTGLLAGDEYGEQGVWFAPHQTIQEHFAARGIQHVIDKFLSNQGEDRVLTELEHSRKDWWLETFIQLAGLTRNPDGLARTVATRNPFLAMWCIEEGKSVSQETREIIEEASIRLIDSKNTGERLNAAQALVQLGTPRITKYLIRLCMDDDEDIRNVANGGLLSYADNVRPELERMLVDEGYEVKKRAHIGRTLAVVRDRRPGVGLRRDGYPDIDWVRIKGGVVQLENVDGDFACADHFYVTRHPVTNAQFEAFTRDMAVYNDDQWWDGFSPEYQKQAPLEPKNPDANAPADSVSWYQAVAFARWLNHNLPLDAYPEGKKPDGYEICLPTEWEWQWIAQGGVKKLEYPYGNEYDPTRANTEDMGIGRSSAVGMFVDGTSPDRVHDLSGNLWEWCYNKWDRPRDWQVDASGEWRSLRGASFYSARDSTRSALRYYYHPHGQSNFIGFRLLVVLA